MQSISSTCWLDVRCLVESPFPRHAHRQFIWLDSSHCPLTKSTWVIEVVPTTSCSVVSTAASPTPGYDWVGVWSIWAHVPWTLIDGAVQQAYGHGELSHFQGRDLALSGCIGVRLSLRPFGDNFGWLDLPVATSWSGSPCANVCSSTTGQGRDIYCLQSCISLLQLQ